MREEEIPGSWRRRQEIIAGGSDVYQPKVRKYEPWHGGLRDVRAAGFLIASSPMHPGSLVHAAPVLDGMGNLIASPQPDAPASDPGVARPRRPVQEELARLRERHFQPPRRPGARRDGVNHGSSRRRVKLRDFPLLTDKNIDPDVVAFLRQFGFDVKDVVEGGLQGSADVD